MTGEVEDRAAEAAAQEAAAREEAAAFASGFKEETKSEPVSEPEPAAAPAAVEPVPEPNPAEPVAADAPPAATESKPTKPKFVRITQEQLDSLTAAAEKTNSLQKSFDTLAGTAGGLRRAIDKLQSETPKGQSFDAAALAELHKEFPEIAGHLEKILGGLKGTGETAPRPSAEPAPKPEPIDADSIKRARDEERFKEELTELAEDYPDWQDIVGQSDKPDQKNQFRQWLNTQSAEYQKKINDTLSPRVIARAIDRFRAATETPRPSQEQPANPAPKANAASARRHVVANAVTPRTAGGPPPVNVKTPEDYFREGFAQG